MNQSFVFLYFYGLHQLYHSALVAMELGEISEHTVTCLSCNKEHTKVLNEIKAHYPNSKTQIIEINQPFRYKYLNFKKKTYPSVNAMIKRARKHLNNADVVLTTSHGTPKMFKKYGITKPKVVYQYHGCGDRRYGFDPEFKHFDSMLVPGLYHQNRLVEENIISREKTKIIGWPKLDYVKLNTSRKLFNNDNPTFLYTPHWKKNLTSYNHYTELILEYFSTHTEYNLIFAPHILIKHWKTSNGYNINYDHYNSDNIVVDFGSESSTNGTYLDVADIYIGDVSSMVFEFIAMKARPCVFLNAHKDQWKGNPDYRFWEYGIVIENESDFESTIPATINNFSYSELQHKRVSEYIEIQDKKSCKRAAEALLGFAG